jgi:enoyl-CoA hydratase/carnithine racemase
MSDETILSETENGVHTITFNRPKKKNAFTMAMYEAIVASLRSALDDDRVRVVLFRGTEGVFTAGNDLVDFAQNPPKSTDTPVFQLLTEIAAYPKPVVAAVQGPAVGLGVTLLLHCDLVYADATAKFVMPFVNLGLVPEGASTFFLPRLAGRVKANELLMFGDPFNAETAVEIGLINAVVEGDVVAHATERAQALAAKPAASLRGTKSLIKQALGARVEETLLREGALFMERLTSPEAMEAFGAFMQKRKPDFSQFK